MYNPLVKEYRGRFGKGRTMDDIVDLVDELPPMPDVITHALRLVDDAEQHSGGIGQRDHARSGAGLAHSAQR